MLTRILLLLALAIASPASAQMTTVFADSPGAGCNGGMAPPSGWNCSQLVFQDLFPGSTLNTSNWVAGLYSINAGGRWTNAGGLAAPLSGINSVANGGNVLDYYDPAQVSVSSGVLTGTMASSSAQTGYSFKGPAICTYGQFQFPTSGCSSCTEIYVQVKRKRPDVTQGAWPGVWLLRAGTTGTEQEIDIDEGGFTGGGTPYNQMMASDVHVGGTDLGQVITNTGVDLSAGYHIYGMHYKFGTIVEMFFDQGTTHVASFTSSILSVPETMQITTDQAASNASSYHTYSASPTVPYTTSIQEVQVYQR